MSKKTTKKALFSSVLALILCFSMLVGTTFAWFTDEVESSMNQIVAGNLDIELYHTNKNDTNEKVTNTTALFDDIDMQKWEPGAVIYENLKIANEGTLALKYQMTLNILGENNLNGHKLSEVLKVAVLETPVAAGTEREAILTAAKAAAAKDNGKGTLSNFYLTGELAPEGETMILDEGTAEEKTVSDTKEFAVVIFWEPGENDNNYNVNNGQTTSDGKPLYIEFGVKLQATQMMNEEDSFGNDYDEPAAFLPQATVNDLGVRDVTANKGLTNETINMSLPFVLQFLPNETAEQAEASDYRYWKADYVVKADKDVPAGSMALAGYYAAYCDAAINGNWVALINEGTSFTAGEELRLVSTMMGRAVNYSEICAFGNDGIGFLCSAVDLTGANAGTTITVELRMYETYPEGECPEDHGGHKSKNCETGKYEVIGTYTYTFPAYPVDDQAALVEAINNGVRDISLAAGTYKMPSSSTTGTVTITGTKDAVIDVTLGAYMDSAEGVTIKGVTIKTSTGYVMDENGNKGADYAALYAKNVTYINCTFVGPMRVGRDGAKFINCTFTELGNDYVWTYGNDVTFEGCTFNTDGKAILIYSDGGNEISEVTVKNCIFNSTKGAKAGAIANQNCAAIEIHNYGNGVKLTTSGNTYDANFSGEWRIKTYETGRTQVFVNGTEYTSIAIDGKLMTIDASKNVTVH